MDRQIVEQNRYTAGHLSLAHGHWKEILKQGDVAVDATCGNGHDTLFLRQIVGSEGVVFALDIQSQAIENTWTRLSKTFHESQLQNVHLIQNNHACFPKEVLQTKPQIIVYNLGYLPGGNKTLKTKETSTLQSLKLACDMIREGGWVSVTCYSGHEGGGEEECAILDWSAHLSSKAWTCCHHRWINRKQSPTVLLIHKKME